VPQPLPSDEVDWKSLEGPYGPSVAVADALRDLWSDDPAARAAAVGALQEALWHQGTVYEVTAPAVPFVADAALGDPLGRDDRIWLILLLAWIAGGTSRWADDAREAVRARLSDFLARLDAETDPGTQVALVDLVAQFPEAAAQARPRVEGLLENEPDDGRRVVLTVALAALGGPVEQEEVLRGIPDEYYDEEEIEEFRQRLGAEGRDVYRDILDNILDCAITFENA
jgi:hypothetical protein